MLRQRVRLYLDLGAIGAALPPETLGLTGRSPAPDTPANSAPLTGDLGRFRILRLLGEGGLARVYLAHDPELGREVALKVIDRGPLVSAQARQWMLNEARSLARLNHPGIVRVFEVGSTERYDYIVMEHLDGPTLAQVIATLARLGGDPSASRASGGKHGERAAELARSLESFRERARLLRHIAAALADCHDRGVLHRDIKPTNILFDQDGLPRLIDFGLAHLPEDESRVDITGNLVGTPAYIAPEQVDSGRTGSDPASDQFSLGIVFYELLTLLSPFERATRAMTMQAISKSEVRPLRKVAPTLPRELALICHHCLERDTAHRYGSIQGLVQDLDAFLAHRAITIAAPSPWRVTALWLQRHRVAATVTAGGAVLLVASLFWWEVGGLSHRRELLVEAFQEVTARPLHSPIEIEGAMETIELTLARAKELEDSTLYRVFFDDLRPLVVQTSARLCDALASELAATRVELAAKNLPMMLDPWDPALRAEEHLCRRDLCPNLADRQRGTIRFDDSIGERRVRVFRHTYLVGPPILRRIELAALPEPIRSGLRPGVGMFRIRIDADTPGTPPVEIDLRVERWSSAHPLRLVAPSPAQLDEMITVPESQYPQPSPYPPLTVPAFRLLPSPITWGHVRAFAAEHPDEVNLKTFTSLSDNDPARISHALATRIAQDLGLRLPTGFELIQAFRGGWIEPIEHEFAVAGELVSDPEANSSERCLSLDYSKLFGELEHPGPQPQLPLDLSNVPVWDAATRGTSDSALELGRRALLNLYSFRLATCKE